MEELNEKIESLEKKVNYLTQLFEEHIMNKKDCKKANTENVLNILEGSPLAEHPIFKTFISSFKEKMKEHSNE